MKRRVIDVPAVHWTGDNETEVDAFAHPFGYRFRANPHGGWSHLHPAAYNGPRHRRDVWIGWWLLIVPECPNDLTLLSAPRTAELYRGVVTP